MKNKLARVFRLFAFLFSLSLLLSALPAEAQTGSVTGTLVDGETGDPLIGANVAVKDSTIGATTDVKGRYQIKKLTSGSYDLVFSYVGYNQKTVTDVEVNAGETTTIDLQLRPEAQQMEEVTVEARLVRNNEAALLKDRQKSASMSDAVSAKAMSQSGSSSAADAMEKVTGASVTDGKYVNIRGLGSRYMNTQLNGAELPSADPDENAVPLDLFPADLLKNIVTTKTFTPDQPGSFTGGNVNISTKTFPAALNVSFSTSTKYNTAISPGETYLSYAGGGVGRFGFNGDKHRLPGMLKNPSFTIPGRGAAASNPAKADTLNQVAKAFGSNMGTSAATAPLNQSYSLSVGNQADFLGNPLGFVGSLSYSRETSGHPNGEAGQYFLETGKSVEAPRLIDNFRITDETVGTEEVLWGGLATLSYRPHPRHEVAATYMHNHSAEATALRQQGRLGQSQVTGSHEWTNQSLSYVERTLQSLQLKGEHAFGSGKSVRATWNSTLSSTNQDEPDRRFFSAYSQRRESQDTTFYYMDASIGLVPQRYFRELEERGWSNNLEVTLPFKQWGGRPAELKLGGSYNMKDRSFTERRFEIRPNFSALRYTGNLNAFYRPENVGVVDTTVVGNYTGFNFANYPVEQRGAAYDADQQIAAGFGMIDLQVLPQLRFVGGVRLERTDMFVKETEVDTTGTLKRNTWLPSANLVYQLQDNMNLRASYGRTLARPTLREFAPYSSFEFLRGYIFNGNLNLDLTTTHNYDLRWEWFTRPGEIVAVSAFYKDFQQPIERVILSENRQVQPRNVDQATVYGAEFEVHKRLGGITSWLSNVEAGANLTLTQSSVSIAEEELQVIREFEDDPATTRPLQDQSPYVVNAHLSYDNARSGTSVGAYFHRFGERLAGVARGGTPDPYEQPRNVLDVTFKQRVDYGLSVKASAKNLLDSPYSITYEFKGQEYVSEEYHAGRTFSVGVSYEY